MQNFHGQKVYRTIDGIRHLVALRPSIRPHPGELIAGFEERMARMEECLYESGAVRVDVLFDYHDDRIVGCFMYAELVPEPAPIDAANEAVVGRAEPRGSRGGQKHNAGQRLRLQPA